MKPIETHEELQRECCDWRGIEDPCKTCGGSGTRAYGSTSTWHGGVGGQMITNGVCDKCWGSGDAHRPWPSRRKMESQAATIDHLTARIAVLAWQPIDTAPYSTPVEVRVGSMTFLARLEPDASLADDEQPCDQWQAVNEGEHPPCWSEGACWSSNTDEVMSRQPEAWRFARTTLEASERGENP